ncbi:MAG TPA: hypothetical protein VHC97_20520 [Thermoanaerobaculia bacterium]|jgi:uncharacterized protein YacL|nr:hypothetical protein [Thermoanaerobaculia bacterium]
MTYQPADEKATDTVAELLKTIIATAGIILTLLWGFLGSNPSQGRLCWTKISSIVLLVSIALALLGLQFMVSALQRKEAEVSKDSLVALCFLGSWISFLAGCGLLMVAFFN